jgi:hypothetical protein
MQKNIHQLKRGPLILLSNPFIAFFFASASLPSTLSLCP